MCGINGIIKFSNEPAQAEHLQKMNDVICYRGPDANKLWCNKNVGLGHVRLSILDLTEAANQPFSKPGFTIVFNGEIYNFQEIREQLTDVDFITNSDTEVVLEAWRKWGDKALERFRGMYAFCIYCHTTGDAWLVRDPFGIKPLFVMENEKGLAFSSELKALESITNSNLSLSQSALLASLQFVWIPEERCIWNEVKKVQPGSYLKIDKSGVVNEVRYWSLPSLIKTEPRIKNENEAVEYISEVLEDSVKAHLAADVPVNAFLSGGLDSSLLVAMARKQLSQLDCYTIKLSDEDHKHEGMADDAYYAGKVAEYLDVKLNTIEIKPDVTDLLPKIVHHLDEPIGDSAAINTFLICDSAAKNGVKVLLSGMGADEMFAGYRKHQANLYADTYRKIPESIRTLAEWPVERLPVASNANGFKIIRWAKRFLSFAGQPEADSFLRSYTYYDNPELLAAFSGDITNDLALLIKEHHGTFNTARYRGLIDAMCFTDVTRFMVSLNLTYSDRASMAASTEVRVPFIDKKVVEAAFNIDASLKIKGKHQKYILKKVAEKWLPKEIIYRPKSSFTMPIRSWVKNELKDMVDKYLLSASGLQSRNILDKRFIAKTVNDDRNGQSDNAQKIWHLLTLEQWFRNHGF